MHRFVLCLILSTCAHAQWPDAPKPSQTLQRTFLAADAAIRTLDVYSTHRMLMNGGHEMLMPDAIASRPTAMAGLEAADVLTVAWLSRRIKRRHPKLAAWLPAIDAAQDAPWAIRNMMIQAHGSVANQPRRYGELDLR